MNHPASPVDAVILISADAEWRPVRERFPAYACTRTPFGETFETEIIADHRRWRVVFLNGGWGKIAAAASTQYAIDRWRPSLLVNLGTCGGFAGDITAGTIILADFTLVYDIIEQMGDPDEARAWYATEPDLTFLGKPYPLPVRRELLLSADRDILMDDIEDLRARYGAAAADWESGAIAFVAARNEVPCLILRGVTDVVTSNGGEAYDNFSLFAERAGDIMNRLLDSLSGWLTIADLDEAASSKEENK
jgi:adenosylhomocysteine nucleosidase